MTDQFAQAIEAQQAALECHRRLGDQRGEGDSLRSLSTLLRYVGRTRDAQSVALEAVELLEPLPPGHELAIAYCNVSFLCLSMEDAAGAVTWGGRALELARRLDDTVARVYALTNLAVVDFRAGETEGQVKLERALALAQRHGLEEHAGRVFSNLVVWPVRHRMFALASTYLEAGLKYSSKRGLDTWRLYLLACRARLELDLGLWSEAADSAALSFMTLVVRPFHAAGHWLRLDSSERGVVTPKHRRRSTRRPSLRSRRASFSASHLSLRRAPRRPG